jgi:hypothetical protein
MSVGGRIIEIKPFTIVNQDNPKIRHNVIKIWTVARNGDECIVYAQPQTNLPKLGDDIWWQSKKIYYDNNKKHLIKFGYSHSP